MKVTVGPAQYIRNKGLLEEAGRYIKNFGKTAALIGGQISRGLVEDSLRKSLSEHEILLKHSLWYGGESSQANIDQLVAALRDEQIDVLITTGGGKAIDTVKAVAYQLNKPLIAIPTIAATCAAATPITILYSNDGEFIGIERKSKAPDLVLVDSEIIMNAPVRFLIAGIGDTLAKWFETKSSVKKAVPNILNQTAVAIAGQVYQTLLQIGKNAVTSVQTQTVTKEFEDVIDTIILVSGSVSGYGGDDCRTAGAHAIYSGLTIFPEVHHTYHGEIVAFGILAQLCMENTSEDELKKLISYYQEVGLPFTLKQMGITNLTESQWQKLGEITVTIEDMANMPFEVSPEMVIEAVRRADEIGNRMLIGVLHSSFRLTEKQI
ncbi:iron-containing alcohol dehydrogenase family protein [Neobacillus sp. MER 74]|uniref:iron-containing alcohol dehydrogenase family protein n=1 Tax=Neobacillus sp. MER 74 TaxID=2939566 RepID=UPI00203F47E9|nr:iron-containing alcohol dehydrogenase family protein [Neobacillus sp. MER 74]MCM3115518.1 iron-containing alcohol dehydrogenase family protein [Neobacillus sp. MER 74]